MARKPMKDKKMRDYEQAVDLHFEGKTISEIARSTKMTEAEVKGYIIDFFRSLS